MNWTERDLDLFKSKRQRGTKPPPAKEFDLHVILGDTLQRWCAPGWRYTHIASGEYRTKATAGRLQRMGLKPGWPDFQFFHCDGAVCFLELKRQGEKMSEVQAELSQFLIAAGHRFLCTDSFTDAVNFLRDNGVLLSRITTTPPLGRDAACAPPEDARID